eukprot:TRINITY_DN30989_c0_g1_i1.p1 TRINITY_DN30989_c0_g1~~TRINITY_DN30989_c0_g1_i1.p1  ORF type:complete len:103 (+),score=22.63 TRINITY_DN30989_c0_g1_i1:24-332(+)
MGKVVMVMVVGWWLVAGGWRLAAGSWRLVAGGWWRVAWLGAGGRLVAGGDGGGSGFSKHRSKHHIIRYLLFPKKKWWMGLAVVMAAMKVEGQDGYNSQLTKR